MQLSDVLERLESSIIHRPYNPHKKYAVVWLDETIQCIPVNRVEKATEVFGYVTEEDCTVGLRSEQWDRLIAHILIFLKRTGKCQDP